MRQRLLERGHDPRTVRRAVRYRRWRELRTSGTSTVRPTGIHHLDLVVSSIERSLALLSRAPGAARLHANRRGRRRARRDDLVLRRPTGRSRAPGGADRRRVRPLQVGVHHVAFEAASRDLVDERPPGSWSGAARSRARARSTRTARAITRSSSTTPTGSSSRSSTSRVAVSSEQRTERATRRRSGFRLS